MAVTAVAAEVTESEVRMKEKTTKRRAMPRRRKQAVISTERVNPIAAWMNQPRSPKELEKC